MPVSCLLRVHTWCTYWQMTWPMLVLLSESAVSIVAITFAPEHTNSSSRDHTHLNSHQDAPH